MLGWTPRQVDDLSLWEFHFAVNGWVKANSASDTSDPLPVAEHDRLMRKYGGRV